MANTTIYEGIEKIPTTFSFDDGTPRVQVLAQVASYTSGTTLTAAQSGSVITFPAMDASATLSLPACAGCLGATYQFVMLGTAGNDVILLLTDQKKFLVVYQKVMVTT